MPIAKMTIKYELQKQNITDLCFKAWILDVQNFKYEIIKVNREMSADSNLVQPTAWGPKYVQYARELWKMCLNR